jgi:hypothetical protein
MTEVEKEVFEAPYRQEKEEYLEKMKAYKATAGQSNDTPLEEVLPKKTIKKSPKKPTTPVEDSDEAEAPPVQRKPASKRSSTKSSNDVEDVPAPPKKPAPKKTPAKEPVNSKKKASVSDFESDELGSDDEIDLGDILTSDDEINFDDDVDPVKPTKGSKSSKK